MSKLYVVGSPADPTMKQIEDLKVTESVLERAIDRVADRCTPVTKLQARLAGMRAELAWLEKRGTR